MRTRCRTGAGLIATPIALVLIFTVTGVWAATAQHHDPVRDARARFDLTKIEAVNSVQRVQVTARVRDLRGTGTQVFGFTAWPVRSDHQYFARTVRFPGGRVTSRVEGPAGVLNCRSGAWWRPNTDRLRLWFDQACIDEHRRLRIGAYIGAGDGTFGDPVDWTDWFGVSYN